MRVPRVSVNCVLKRRCCNCDGIDGGRTAFSAELAEITVLTKFLICMTVRGEG